jgi:tetratricopeptide (TPR) repeat protein
MLPTSMRTHAKLVLCFTFLACFGCRRREKYACRVISSKTVTEKEVYNRGDREMIVFALQHENVTIKAHCQAFDYISLDRLDEAEEVFKQAEERKLESESLLFYHYQLPFLKGDTAKMTHLASAAVGKLGAEDLLMAAQADTEGWSGKLKNAHELTRRAMDSAQRNDAKESAASYQAAAALREVESGNREQALADANAALKLAPNRDVQAIVALTLARAEDTAGAEKLAAGIDKTFPLDTLVQRYWLPTIRAAVALDRKDPTRATDLLKGTSTIELGQATSNLTIYL